MSRVVATIILSSVAFAQNAPNPELERAAKSPYDLARYIDSHTGFDWEPLWKSLGVVGASLLPCERSGDCSTETDHGSRTAADDSGDRHALEHGSLYPLSWETKAKGGAGRERYEALIKNYPRRHEMTTWEGKPFLRVASQGVSGSDVSSEGGGLD